LSKLGEKEEAKEGYLKALKINQNYFGEAHINYARNLINLSKV
jgi:hypothetical protein